MHLNFGQHWPVIVPLSMVRCAPCIPRGWSWRSTEKYRHSVLGCVATPSRKPTRQLLHKTPSQLHNSALVRFIVDGSLSSYLPHSHLKTLKSQRPPDPIRTEPFFIKPLQPRRVHPGSNPLRSACNKICPQMRLILAIRLYQVPALELP